MFANCLIVESFLFTRISSQQRNLSVIYRNCGPDFFVEAKLSNYADPYTDVTVVDLRLAKQNAVLCFLEIDRFEWLQAATGHPLLVNVDLITIPPNGRLAIDVQ